MAPGTTGVSGEDDILCVFWKSGGHITVPGMDLDEFMEAVAAAAIPTMPY